MNSTSSFLIDADATAITVSRPLQLTRLDFATNPQPRCPVVLLLDSSSSMSGAPIQELQEALAQFYQEVGADPIARLSVELCVIPFGSDVKIIRGFEPVVDALRQPRPWLSADGYTPMGTAISLGLSAIRKRRDFYKNEGLSAYKPWLVLMTDGQPNDDWQGPAAEARRRASEGRLFFFGVGIGDGVDMCTLASILPPDNPPRMLQGLRFQEFFKWLTDSLKIVTSSATTQKRTVPDPADYDWAM